MPTKIVTVPTPLATAITTLGSMSDSYLETLLDHVMQQSNRNPGDPISMRSLCVFLKAEADTPGCLLAIQNLVDCFAIVES